MESKLTAKEVEVLLAIINNENGVSVDEFRPIIVESAALGGVLGSLSKKGLIQVDTEDEPVYYISAQGLEAITDLRESYLSDLRSSDCEVVFIKKDGSKRTLKCTLREDVLNNLVFADKTPTEGRVARKPSVDTISAWDLEKEAWRSFRLDTVVSFSKIA